MEVVGSDFCEISVCRLDQGQLKWRQEVVENSVITDAKIALSGNVFAYITIRGSESTGDTGKAVMFRLFDAKQIWRVFTEEEIHWGCYAPIQPVWDEIYQSTTDFFKQRQTAK